MSAASGYSLPQSAGQSASTPTPKNYAAAKVAQQRQYVQIQRDKTSPQRLAAADRLVQEGDLRTACLIDARLTVARPPTPYSEAAKVRLRQLQDDARLKLKGFDDQLEDASLTAFANPEQVADLFAQYDQLVRSSAGIPTVGRELARHVAKQRRDPRYAAMLQEAQARQLLALGRQLRSGE